MALSVLTLGMKVNQSSNFKSHQYENLSWNSEVKLCIFFRARFKPISVLLNTQQNG